MNSAYAEGDLMTDHEWVTEWRSICMRLKDALSLSRKRTEYDGYKFILSEFHQSQMALNQRIYQGSSPSRSLYRLSIVPGTTLRLQ